MLSRPLDIVNELGFRSVDKLGEILEKWDEVFFEWKTRDSKGRVILLRVSGKFKNCNSTSRQSCISSTPQGSEK